MKTLFLAWQDPTSRFWFPIGRLTFESGQFSFVYIRGAEKAEETSTFQPLPSFPDFSKIYRSRDLFPLFANRVMRPSRPDYQNYLECLDIPQHTDDPIAILSRSGGKKATDHFEVFPCPEADEHGLYHIHFFIHGLRHRPSSAIERVGSLNSHELLYLMHDFQNPHDPQALALRTEDSHMIGYCPRYLALDIHELLKQDPKLVNVHVERVNPTPAPIQLRLLCNMTAEWPTNFRPFSSDEYQPLVNVSSPVEAIV
jgi:HIRAN domain